MKTAQEVMQIIQLGAMVCQRIKNALFAQSEWGACHTEISNYFTMVKNKTRSLNPNIDVLEKLVSLDKESFLRLLN